LFSVGAKTTARMLSNDIRNWTLGDTKNWTPFGSDVAALPAGGLVQVVHRRDPHAGVTARV